MICPGVRNGGLLADSCFDFATLVVVAIFVMITPELVESEVVDICVGAGDDERDKGERGGSELEPAFGTILLLRTVRALLRLRVVTVVGGTVR